MESPSLGRRALLLLGDPAEASATTEDTDQFQLEFEPGALTQLGAEPEPIPQKPIHDATHAADPQTPDTVTDQPIVTEPEPDSPEPVPKPETRPDTNPYNEANNDAPDIGDPFGDPEGWAETLADGDPRATGVMKALNGMSVPAYAGQLPAGKSQAAAACVGPDGQRLRAGEIHVRLAAGSSAVIDPATRRAFERDLRHRRSPTLYALVAPLAFAFVISISR